MILSLSKWYLKDRFAHIPLLERIFYNYYWRFHIQIFKHWAAAIWYQAVTKLKLRNSHGFCIVETAAVRHRIHSKIQTVRVFLNINSSLALEKLCSWMSSVIHKMPWQSVEPLRISEQNCCSFHRLLQYLQRYIIGEVSRWAVYCSVCENRWLSDHRESYQQKKVGKSLSLGSSK